MPVAPPFERAAKREQDGGEDDCNGRGPPGGKTTQDAKERGDPNGGRGGQSVHLAVAVAMQNDARPKEANADDDALNDAGDLRLRIICNHQYRERRSHADKPKRAHARGLVVQLMIEAERTANEHRSADPKHDVLPAEPGATPSIEAPYATPPRGPCASASCLGTPRFVPWHPAVERHEGR